MYQPQGLSETIFRERYAVHPEESWDNASKRVADHVASAEEAEDKQRVSEQFYEEIATNRFMPGGRIWYGAGRPRAQLLNCFVIPTHDSREGWGKTVSDVIIVSGMGGGIGVNCSPIRPRNSPIHGTGGKATGAVSLMQMIDRVGDVIQDGGGRRLALMLDLNITHPDMPEFLDKKLDKHELTNANISIIIDKNLPTKELVRKVREGEDFDLVFANQHGKTVNAKSIWERLVQNAWTSGEPGVLNGDFANQENNIWYHKPLISTNPCGEIWLEEYGSCDLGALVLPRFVNDLGDVDWFAMKNTIHTAVRFLDDVLTVNEYPLQELRDNCTDVRRVGLGIMGLHDMLLKMGLRYSSDAAKTFVSMLMQYIKEEAYLASTELAVEKGPFAAYSEDFLESGFVKRALPNFVKERIALNGIRNCALLTIAPTGTTGMVSNVSTGIEPIFSAAYWRRYHSLDNNGTRVRNQELVLNPHWEEFERKGKDISLLEGAYDVSPEDHFAMQQICQYHIDNAVSKTVNLPENYAVDSLSDLWLEYLPYLKGTTFYRAGSRENEPLKAIPLAEAREVVHKNKHTESNILEQNLMDCIGDSCAIPESLKPKIESRLDIQDKIAFV